MAWAGTGVFCIIQGGVLKSYSLSQMAQHGVDAAKGDLSFVQISDSHIGFSKPANTDVTATLQEAVAKITVLPPPLPLALHRVDFTHPSNPKNSIRSTRS